MGGWDGVYEDGSQVGYVSVWEGVRPDRMECDQVIHDNTNGLCLQDTIQPD